MHIRIPKNSLPSHYTASFASAVAVFALLVVCPFKLQVGPGLAQAQAQARVLASAFIAWLHCLVVKTWLLVSQAPRSTWQPLP